MESEGTVFYRGRVPAETALYVISAMCEGVALRQVAWLSVICPRRVWTIRGGKGQYPSLEATLLTEDIDHYIPHPIRGLSVAREPSDAVQMIAQGNDRRFFHQLSLLGDNLP